MSSLAAYQAALGRALREGRGAPHDMDSAGWRLTLKVRRSWCLGRSVIAARTVLAALPEAEQRRLAGEYIDRGGGLEMSLAREAERFLAFLAPRLPEPSHALALCRLQQALARARAGRARFAPPVRIPEMAAVDRGRRAALVWFHADPGELLAALRQAAPLPPPGPAACPVLVAPGLPELFRPATAAEVKLWRSLPAPELPAARVRALLAQGVLRLAAAGCGTAGTPEPPIISFTPRVAG